MQNTQFVHSLENEVIDDGAGGKLKQVGVEVKRLVFAGRKSLFLMPILKQFLPLLTSSITAFCEFSFFVVMFQCHITVHKS